MNGEPITIPTLSEPLRAVRNVIELKPGKKYLLLFFKQILTKGEMAGIQYALDAFGVQALVCCTEGDVEIVEAPAEREERHE